MMNPPATITVVAQWRVREGNLGEVLAYVSEVRAATLAEPGCLSYDVFQATGASDTLLLLERYRDGAALEAHRQSNHYQALVVGRILPLLSQRQIELLQALAAA